MTGSERSFSVRIRGRRPNKYVEVIMHPDSDDDSAAIRLTPLQAEALGCAIMECGQDAR